MKLKKRGKNTSEVEISNIGLNGIWLLVKGKEYFLFYENFPWFKKAAVAQIHDVTLLHDNHLHWKELDIDLELESLGNLEQYPLVYR